MRQASWLGRQPLAIRVGKKTQRTSVALREDTVVVDGHVITARGAGAAGYFALALVEQLFGAEKAAEVKSAVVMDIVEKNLGL